jgi:hypothetical protein
MTEIPKDIESPAGGRNLGDGVDTTAPASPQVEPSSRPNAPRQRDGQGRFLPGHTVTLTTAQHTDRLPPHLDYIEQEVEMFNRGSLTDEGDQSVPTRRRSQLGYRGLVHRNILAVAGALEGKGITDPRGKLRVAWLSKLESLINTAVRIDTLLGLERRSKSVNKSPRQWLESLDQNTEGEEGNSNDEREPETDEVQSEQAEPIE